MGRGGVGSGSRRLGNRRLLLSAPAARAPLPPAPEGAGKGARHPPRPSAGRTRESPLRGRGWSPKDGMPGATPGSRIRAPRRPELRANAYRVLGAHEAGVDLLGSVQVRGRGDLHPLRRGYGARRGGVHVAQRSIRSTACAAEATQQRRSHRGERSKGVTGALPVACVSAVMRTSGARAGGSRSNLLRACRRLGATRHSWASWAHANRSAAHA